MNLRNKKSIEIKAIKKRSYRRKSVAENDAEDENLQLRLDSSLHDTCDTKALETEAENEQSLMEIDAECEPASNKKTKKRTRAQYSKVQTFQSRKEMDFFIRTMNEFNLNITHNDQTRCTICDDDCDDHNMQQIYLKCACKKCNLKYVSFYKIIIININIMKYILLGINQ